MGTDQLIELRVCILTPPLKQWILSKNTRGAQFTNIAKAVTIKQ